MRVYVQNLWRLDLQVELLPVQLNITEEQQIAQERFVCIKEGMMNKMCAFIIACGVIIGDLVIAYTIKVGLHLLGGDIIGALMHAPR